MDNLAGTPFSWLNLDASGTLAAGDEARLSSLLATGPTDLVVISHGWKTDLAGALELYEPLWTNVLAALAQAGKQHAGFAVAGVSWPAMEFKTDFDVPAAGAGAALAMPPDAFGADIDLPDADFQAALVGFATFVGSGKLDALRQAADAVLRDTLDSAAADAFSLVGRGALPSMHAGDGELAADRALWSANSGREQLLALAPPPDLSMTASVGAALSVGGALTGLFSGPRAAMARLLNQFTYYEMKSRAGLVGAALGSGALSRIGQGGTLRLHLVGHSFGARLVTAAANALSVGQGVDLRSLTLLQGAFSHNALSASFVSHVLGGASSGPFSAVLDRVSGPISITHTHNDSACTLYYALASRLSRDNAKAIGDKDDEFGAMGANGAQNLAPQRYGAEATLDPGGDYALSPGTLHNVLADACIKSHMDVTNVDVARLLAAAVTA